MCNAVSLLGVSLKYNERAILNNINLSIKTGSITGIMGLSGAGKTSLIRIINGNIKNDANVYLTGKVMILGQNSNNENISDYCTIASIYQDPDTQIIFPNVLDEIVFGMENYQFTKSEMDKQLNYVTNALGIHHLLDRNANKLSGGEKQLVVLSSILCLSPKILLLDECISQIDEQGKNKAKQMLQNLKEQGTAIIMVEHNLDNLSIADNIYSIANNSLILQQKDDLFG